MNYENLVAWLKENKLNGFRLSMDDAIATEANNLRIGALHVGSFDERPEQLDHLMMIAHCRAQFMQYFRDDLLELIKDPQPSFVVTASDVLCFTTRSIARALAWEYSKRK